MPKVIASSGLAGLSLFAGFFCRGPGAPKDITFWIAPGTSSSSSAS